MICGGFYFLMHAVVKVLPRLEFSDHHPILIALHGFERETYLRLLNLNVHG